MPLRRDPYSDSSPVPHHIAGRRLAIGPLSPVHNPANGQATRQLHQADEAQIARAIESARYAQPGWAACPPLDRARVLQRFAQQVEAGMQGLADIIVSEQGKTRAEALDEIRRGLGFVEYACAIPELMAGQHSGLAAADQDQWALSQPVGICAGVTPFHAPFLVPMWMAPLALACGNAFILKPSPLTPSTSVWVAEALLSAGLPPGLFQVLQGGPAVAQGLLRHRDLAALSLVGQSRTARDFYAEGCGLGKRVQALGGAKNHAVVMPDLTPADFDRTADALIDAAYGMAGQRCMAISALLLVGQAGDALLPRLAERLARWRVGPGHHEGIDMGPLGSAAAKSRVEALIHSGELDGARLLVDGRGLQVAGHLGGYFLGPTLFDHVQPWMQIYQEEAFGPLLVALRVRDLDGALAVIQDHPQAQGASLFTRDGAVARRFTQQVETGMVSINLPLSQPMAWLGAGGWKGSQLGALQAYGPDGVRFYTQRKAVVACWH